MSDTITKPFLVRFFALELLLVGVLKLISDVPTWVYFAASASLLAGLWIWDSRKDSIGWLPQWHLVLDDVVPFRRTILLTEAAKYARDQTVLKKSGKLSELLDDDPLSYMATALGMEKPMEAGKFPGPLQLYGRRFNSSRRVLIPMSDRKITHIRENGAVLWDSDKGRPMYTHLEILRHEMKKRVRYLSGME
jgi:hypothetical protein